MSDINLGSIISNPTARKVIYAVYAIAGLVLGGIQAWYGVIGDTPTWLAQYLAVYGYLGIPVGGLAIANTPHHSEAGVDTLIFSSEGYSDPTE